MEIRLLGPLELRSEGRTVPLPRRQHRALLAALALRAGEVTSTDRLVEDLWGSDAPASAVGSLQNAVSGLRKLLGHEVVTTQAPGYRLAIAPEAVDALRFEQLLAEARDSEGHDRAGLLREALALWRGPALADLAFEPFAAAEIARLEELRLGAVEERIEADLSQGLHAQLVPELETLVGQQPLRERLRGLLMLALYRCGRQAEALEVYRAARLALADELGLDPSPELQELERRVLRQDPELAAPAEVAAEAVEPAAERRLVTALAAVPPANDDPERHRLLLDETLLAVQDALERNGGTLERFGPEGLLALFGAEAPRDDDAQRALATARELGLRAGLATGEIVGGAGAVVNRAVELARSEGIALDERTRTLVGARRRLDAPLAGREPELARLRKLFADASAGRCRVATVLGEPGIGKTRLARELLVEIGEEAEILVARCLAYGEGATFLPLLAALRRAEPERVLAAEPDAELVVARLAALGGGEPGSLGESYWAVRRLLERLAERRPVVLALDDVHWAEPALLDLVDYLAERAQAPLLVLCLARPELERTLGEPVRLGPLADDEARAVVRGTAELDEETSARIVELAEGNALYLEQLAAYAAEAGKGLPPTLEAVLAGRLGQLGDEERAVLQRAAVVGREFTRGAVAALADQPVDAQLAALGRRGLIRAAADAEPGDDAYRFHHVLLRDAAYATLTKLQRAALHERTATWLDRDEAGDDAIAGYHLEQAALLRRDLGEDATALAERAGERLGDAAMRAWRMNDIAAAVSTLRRTTALLPSGPRRAELLWEQSIAERLRGLHDEAAATLADAAKEAFGCGSSALAARAKIERVRVELFSGKVPLDRAISTMNEARATLERESDARGLGRADLCMCSLHSLACNMREVKAGAARSIVHYTAAGFSPAACIGQYAEALYYGPTPVDAAIAEATALLDGSGDEMTTANVTTILGGLNALAGATEEADSLLEDARELFEALGGTSALMIIWSPLRIEADALAGDLDAAITRAKAVIADLPAGSRAWRSTYAAWLADLLLLEGEDAEAADHYTQVAERDGLPSDVLVQFLARADRARLLARAGELEEAELIMREAVALSSLTDVLRDRARVHVALAEILALAGKGPEAQVEEDTAAGLLRRKGVKGALASAPFT